MKIKELIDFGKKKLNDIEDTNIVVKMLIKYLLNMNDSDVIINMDMEVDPKIEEKYFEYLEEILKGKPIQYITNKQEFMGLEFYVNENVLIPQPDTEILVEEVINICKKYNNELKVLDVCAGSGAIGISIAKYIDSAKVSISDISKEALNIARRNAIANSIDVEIFNSNMFENINGKFDIIVSNPPYIKTCVIEKLDKFVQNEPHLALDGGEDGLDFYKILATESKKYLKDGGYLCMEIGYDQKNEVIQILEESQYLNIYCKKDLSGNDRIIIANV